MGASSECVADMLQATYEVENCFWSDMRHHCYVYQKVNRRWSYVIDRMEKFRLMGQDIEIATQEMNATPMPVVAPGIDSSHSVLHQTIIPALIHGFNAEEGQFMIKKELVKSFKYTLDEFGEIIYAEIWHDLDSDFYEGRLFKQQYIRVTPSFPQNETGEAITQADVAMRVPHQAFIESSDLSELEAALVQTAEAILEDSD